ncbi:hypothetical protein HRbin24_00403 [bacterium HR24]|nr:hypothetical protein HRbin24_00403 [bacterium HR24]
MDLETEAADVYRRPAGKGYDDVRKLRRGDALSPLAFPAVALAVEGVVGPSRAQA